MDSNNLFEDITVFKEKGYGINIIDHDTRCEFDMTVSQYCAVDIIAQRKIQKKTTSILDISTFIGVDGNTIQLMLEKLEERKLVLNQDGNYYLSKRLADKINKVEDYSKDFEEFWTIPNEKGKLISVWSGAKPKAQKLYEKARQNRRTHKFILDQRYWYFKILEIETYQRKMIVTRFLNIDSGELDQDFKKEYQDLMKKKGRTVEEVSAITMKDFKKEFSQ